jgi:hypothetical protein
MKFQGIQSGSFRKLHAQEITCSGNYMLCTLIYPVFFVVLLPASFLTVNVTSYVPALVYVWVAFMACFE